MFYSGFTKIAKKTPCWEGYERVPGTKQGEKGSCRKISDKKKSEKK